MIEELDALSAWVEVSSESESVCSFGGHERFHRTRERGTGGHRGYFRHPVTQPTLYNNPSPPKPAIRVSLSQIRSHPPGFAQICSPQPPLPETLDPEPSQPFDL